MRRALLAALLVAACLVAPSAAWGELLAASGDQLWLIGDDGTSRTAVPRGGHDPAWTADGARFAVTVSVDDDRTRLEVGSPDGGGRTTVAGSDGLTSPSWSPAGDTLVAVRRRESGDDELPVSELVLLPAAGGAPRTLTTGAYDVAPAWSPDGAEIAFTRATFEPRRAAPTTALLAIRPDGSGLRRIAGDGVDAAWSPDGARLAFTSTRDRNGRTCFHDCSPNGEIYVVGADGGGEGRLTDHPADDREPAWSPDGARIAFASSRHYPAGGFPEVWAMDADGSCATQLTFGSDHLGEPAWRPGDLPVGRGPCGVRLAPYHDAVDLRRVRVRDAVPLYPDRAFEGMLLSRAEGALIALDECDVPDPERCPGEIQLRTETTCARNPSIYDIASRGVFTARGALVVDWGDAVDVMSGGTTTTIYGRRPRAVLRRIVAALRPTSGPENLDRPLPRARLPRRAWRALRNARRARRGPRLESHRSLVRSDRRFLRAARRHGSRRRPACE